MTKFIHVELTTGLTKKFKVIERVFGTITGGAITRAIAHALLSTEGSHKLEEAIFVDKTVDVDVVHLFDTKLKSWDYFGIGRKSVYAKVRDLDIVKPKGFNMDILVSCSKNIEESVVEHDLDVCQTYFSNGKAYISVEGLTSILNRKPKVVNKHDNIKARMDKYISVLKEIK